MHQRFLLCWKVVIGGKNCYDNQAFDFHDGKSSEHNIDFLPELAELAELTELAELADLPNLDNLKNILV